MFSFAQLVFLVTLAFTAGVVAAPNTPRQNNLPPPFNGTHIGEATAFQPGLGACASTNGPNELIAAISTQLFDSFPGPSSICQESITASFQGRSVTVQVADRCASCAEFDLELSVPAFADIAGDSPGPVRISWFFD